MVRTALEIAHVWQVSRRPDDGAAESAVGEAGTTPLLGHFMLDATWANSVEHAADRLDYWGSRGRGFKSRRPDVVKGQLSWPFVLSAVNVSVGH